MSCVRGVQETAALRPAPKINQTALTSLHKWAMMFITLHCLLWSAWFIEFRLALPDISATYQNRLASPCTNLVCKNKNFKIASTEPTWNKSNVHWYDCLSPALDSLFPCIFDINFASIYLLYLFSFPFPFKWFSLFHR